MKKEVLRKAHVVFTLLNHDVSTCIVEMMKTDGKQSHYCCVIIDQVRQNAVTIKCLICFMLSSLIPSQPL